MSNMLKFNSPEWPYVAFHETKIETKKNNTVAKENELISSSRLCHMEPVFLEVQWKEKGRGHFTVNLCD